MSNADREWLTHLEDRYKRGGIFLTKAGMCVGLITGAIGIGILNVAAQKLEPTHVFWVIIASVICLGIAPTLASYQFERRQLRKHIEDVKAELSNSLHE